MREELLKGLSEEQIAKLKQCRSSEEILKLAKKEGLELSDDQLEAVSGGNCAAPLPPCPRCNSNEAVYIPRTDNVMEYECNECGYRWTV
ncbi:MAG: hypothetical protein IJ787_07220 [Bacilli bacterium]|nr:hypothetical protein [Bacilli bacterium]